MFQIEILKEQHTESYKSLRLKSYQESPFAFSESFEDEVKKPDDHFAHEIKQVGEPPEQFILGAFNDSGDLTGFVKFRRDQRSKARHKSMIHAMYVAPEFRNNGLGKQLINNLLERVKQLDGLEQIHLWVLHIEGNSASAFYQSCGFVSQGTVVKKDLKVNDQYIDAEYMVMYF